MSYLNLLTMGVLPIIIAIFLDAICEKTMVTLEDTLQKVHEWTVDRLHILCDTETDDVLKSVEDAHALRMEFDEWLNPDVKDHEIFSLEYIGDY